jgi:hypothetical protein
VQLTLQDLLDNRQIQAAEPGLGFNSAIAKERKPNEHVNAIPAQAIGLSREAYIPPPWEVFYEFARLVCVGFAVTFGPRRACVGEDRRPKVEARQRVSRFTESVPDSHASVDDRVPAGCAQ